MGIVPPIGSQDPAVGPIEQVVYHGGSVMRDVTVHTVFWAPPGYSFPGSPSVGALAYEQLIQQFFTDVARDSGSTANAMSVLPQYGDSSGAGTYSISYIASADSISDGAPYPPPSAQCASPAGLATCVTDTTIEHEVNRLVSTTDPAGRGLHDLWFVFLPPNVDSCDTAGDCGTNAFAGYHSLFDFGSGPTIYALAIDPSIEITPPPGSDPEGNPDAESTIDTAAHETVEAMTDPEGVGWMDPDGNEVADKCETPEYGPPLGFAPDGSPYNQVINGHPYLFQMMWSNAAGGCVQTSAQTTSLRLPPAISLRQFSPVVTGNIGAAVRGVSVQMVLLRGGFPVAGARAVTDASGSWRLTLRAHSGALEAVGDDRDVILARYGRAGPAPEAIATGSPGNPFTAAGFTGWFDLDYGYQVNSRSIELSPCFQVGVLAITVGGVPTEPPVPECNGDTAVATVTTPKLGLGAPLLMSSDDNRAPTSLDPVGALVKMTIAPGEPASVPAISNPDVPFGGSGFPLCVADLRTQSVSCGGLVPGARYSLTRRRRHAVLHARADGNGVARFAGFHGLIRGGDLLTLKNRAGRALTALHVAHLRVDIAGNESVLSGGTCQPLGYWGPPVTSPPTTTSVGNGGVTGQGTICPPRGRAAGLPAADIAEIDDLSGGQTRTELASLLTTTPAQGAVLYGPFVALAQTGFRAPHGSQITTGTRVALVITRPGSSHAVFSSANVNTLAGVPVTGLTAGVYSAKWVVRDVNGDTRTVRTRFVEQG